MKRFAAYLLLAAFPVLQAQDEGIRLKLVTTAHQFGPVGYRDPLGVISPSGEWLAYSTAQRLYVQRAIGGPIVELPPCDATIRHLAWLPDNRTVVVDSGDPKIRWWSYDIEARSRHPLWPGKSTLVGKLQDSGQTVQIELSKIEQLIWSADGKVAGVAHTPGATELWTLNSDGAEGQVITSGASLSFPAWSPDGKIACLSFSDGRQTLSFPCAKSSDSSIVAYGPTAFSPDGKRIYAGTPNTHGTVDLWSYPVSGGAGTRLTEFATDTYAPSVAHSGAVIFKRSDYRTFVSTVPATGGAVTPVALFQSMTPSWSPKGDQIALTFGTWRRVPDDFHYPDIVQDIGLIPSSGEPARAPAKVVLASPSEDQGLCWSPNGKWIVLHSHKDLSDDLWIEPADFSRPPEPLTHFGRVSETDWPRWSWDGKWVLVASYKHGETPLRHTLFLVGVDQNTGTVTQAPQEIPIPGFTDDITHAEWLSGTGDIVFQAYHDGNKQTFYSVPRAGGRPKVLFQFLSDQHVSGFGVSPEGKWIAYVAPASGGHLQLFRHRVGSGAGEQLTFDPSNKTQPSYSPDGTRIALAVWSFDVQFWSIDPPAPSQTAASGNAARPVGPIIERTEYWALPGKADEVYRWRLHACDVREKLGLPRGQVFRRQGDSATLPDVVWQVEYPDEAARAHDFQVREASAEFRAVREHMDSLRRRFERGFWLPE
jgi:Tol biopolymer transport system component